MFGKDKNKKKDLEKKPKVSADIRVIPEIFYGGKDPVIYKSNFAGAKQVTVDGKEKKKPETKKEPPKKPVEKPHPIPKAAPMPKPNPQLQKPPKRKKKGIWIVLIILLLCILAGGVYYFVFRSAPEPEPAPQPEPPVVVQPEPVPEPEPEPEPELPTTTEPVVPTTTPALDDKLELPKVILSNSVDLDRDGLTDIEEELYQTDSGQRDSDNDTYLDGQEVKNLYNPTGFAPVKLIESGLVTEYENRNYGYRVYYPAAWEMGEVDADKKQVLLSSISGDYIDISVYEKEEDQTFEQWFATNIDGQFSDLRPIETRFKLEAFKRRDGLVAYFEDDKNIYVLSYHPGVAEEIAYRLTMEMVVESFRPESNVEYEIEEQEVVPEEGSVLIVPIDLNSSTSSNETVSTTNELLAEEELLQEEEEIEEEDLFAF